MHATTIYKKEIFIDEFEKRVRRNTRECLEGEKKGEMIIRL